MILHAPGYNLTRQREPARATTGRGFVMAVSPLSVDSNIPLLGELCDEIVTISIQGNLALPITDLCMDSRRVSPGALFFALPGEQTNGSFYIEEAIDRGAVAIVTEEARQHHQRATFIQVADARFALAAVARRFFQGTADGLRLTGVMGSHGKTCVSHLLKHLLGKDGPVGLLSSIHYDLGSRMVPSYRTTPEAIDLYGMLAQIGENGCRQAVLELSSHGIVQQRVSGLPLDVAVFLNLGREHAAVNGGEEGYFAAKRALFTGEAGGPLPGAAVVNLDDSYGLRLIQMIPERVRLVTFGRSPHADIRGVDVTEGEEGISMRIIWPEGTARVRSGQLGSFSVSNILAAVAAAYAGGIDLNFVLPRLVSYGGTPGRMESVEIGQPFRLLVDYAYTPESIRHALRAGREMAKGRLLVVFGCCGQRERSVRRRVVEAVQEEADFCWATADNPRNEALGQIFDDMREGVLHPERMVMIDDRRRAIALALDTALLGDVVMLLGKGHEPFQYLGDAALPFDDRLIARELLALREVALAGN